MNTLSTLSTLSPLAWVLPVALGFLGSLPAAAADRDTDTGRQAYYDKCASCHGVDAKGQGLVAKFLIKAPRDLTTLSKKNGGVFPYLHVEAVIDGRATTAVHGDRDMPVWGGFYLREGERTQANRAQGLIDAEGYAHMRVLALMDYLYRIQQK
jgi:mono/diheme cytochrome c family protein